MDQISAQTNQAVAPRARILIVDDDALFRESLAGNLAHIDFAVEEAGGGADALSRLQSGTTPDLILLDWKLPGMNGIEVLRQLREARILVPVLFLTVLSDEMYEEAALQVGAVDFVEKHRAFTILLKRIELILAGAKVLAPAASGPPETGSLRVGPLELRFDINRALWIGERIDLSLTEFRVVCRATLDLIEQARPRARLEIGVGAGAQKKGAFQRIDGAVDRAGIGERAVITAGTGARAAVLEDLRRPVVGGDQDIGERLVVA